MLRPLEVSREPLITNKLVEVKELDQSFLVVCQDLRGVVGMGRTGRNRHIAGGWAEAVVFGASWCKVVKGGVKTSQIAVYIRKRPYPVKLFN